MNAIARIRAEHAMLGTPDYDATLAWWTDVLGFRVEIEWTVPALPGLRLAYLEKNGFRLEVVGSPERFQARGAPADLGQHLTDSGYAHLAFVADDVDAVMAELAAKGVPGFFPATSFPDVGRRVAFVMDPHGNVVEFATDLAGGSS
jgi:catechol 2,3-dioxygenase-like lactoylglutathione lyase family enzyme